MYEINQQFGRSFSTNVVDSASERGLYHELIQTSFVPFSLQSSSRAHSTAPCFQPRTEAQPLAALPPYGCGLPLVGTAMGSRLGDPFEPLLQIGKSIFTVSSQKGHAIPKRAAWPFYVIFTVSRECLSVSAAPERCPL